MSTATAALLAELNREAKTTRRVLERVSTEKLTWKPHARSRTLGQLSAHLAGIPGGMARRARAEGMDASEAVSARPQPEAGIDFVAVFDAGVAEARDLLAGMDDGAAAATWRMTYGNREIFAIPRVEMLRSMLFNHWYHHRGQLVVYLRMLDIPVPAVYGVSADESWLGPPEGQAVKHTSA